MKLEGNKNAFASGGRRRFPVGQPEFPPWIIIYHMMQGGKESLDGKVNVAVFGLRVSGLRCLPESIRDLLSSCIANLATPGAAAKRKPPET
jgi:hypothetical protein